ncbi:MAG: ATP-binding cassette domain-containing protein [Candidatus Dormibacteraceae bacterium]
MSDSTNGLSDRRSAHPVIQLRDASKAFGQVVALDGASLVAYAGEVLALVGDNGAGKSTIVKILAGVHHMDSGELLIDGEQTQLGSPSQARALGIATVFQDLSLVECLDIADNMYLGRPPRRWGFLIDRSKMVEGAADILQQLKVHIASVQIPVAALSGGQRQAVALARAVLQGGRVMLMDEPTAALGVRETKQVLDLVSQLRSRGAAVILVSHNLEAVFDVADRIQVMRLGRVQGVRRLDQTDRNEIVGLITGAVRADEAFVSDRTVGG